MGRRSTIMRHLDKKARERKEQNQKEIDELRKRHSKEEFDKEIIKRNYGKLPE